MQQSVGHVGFLYQGTEVGVPVVGDAGSVAQQVADGDLVGGGIVSGAPDAGFTSTFGFLNSGRYLEIGSSSRKWPSSYSIMTARLVMGLVMEQMRNMRVRAHRLARLTIGHTLRLEPCHVSATGDERDRTGNALVIDAALHRAGEPLQPFRRQADGFRFDDGYFLRERRRGDSTQKKIRNVICRCMICRFMSKEAPCPRFGESGDTDCTTGGGAEATEGGSARVGRFA